MKINGIDVSVYQGDISWPTVERNSDVKFAMIKATYGKNGIDPKFTSNITGINATDIPAGAYHYFTAQTPSEAITEATHFVDTVKPYKISYPLALSLINEDLIPLGKEKLTENVLTFLDKIKTSGYAPILFTNLGFINNYLDMNKLENTEIWLAEWGSRPTYARNVTMWQYKSTGKVYGIDTDVDMNISYIDYASAHPNTANTAYYSKNDLDNNVEINSNGITNFVQNNKNIQNNTESTVSKTSAKNFENSNLPNTDFYTVSQGENLGTIAQKVLGDSNKYQQIADLNGLNNSDIYAGQILRIPNNSSNNVFLYRVKRGDTLWKIAQRFLKNGSGYRQIMIQNGLTNDMIYPGQILKVPSL